MSPPADNIKCATVVSTPPFSRPVEVKSNWAVDISKRLCVQRGRQSSSNAPIDQAPADRVDCTNDRCNLKAPVAGVRCRRTEMGRFQPTASGRNQYIARACVARLITT
jgi:hypothetical protein